MPILIIDKVTVH